MGQYYNEEGVIFQEQMLEKMGLPENFLKPPGGDDANAIPDATNTFSDPTQFSGMTNQIVEVKRVQYLDLSASTREGIQARVYAYNAQAWGGGEVDWIVPEGADYNESAFRALSRDFPGARLRIYMNNPDRGFINLASSDDWAEAGQFYDFSETRGFRLQATIDWEEEMIEQLEEEGYSPGQAEMTIEGGAGEGGEGWDGAAP
jgi:hypothetical protein